jgi:hypothetical protein
MHPNCYDLCRGFALGLLTHRPGHPLLIADVGSFEVHGAYRPLFDKPGWRYVGFAIKAGANVDVVLSSSDGWELSQEQIATFDVVISGQCFEHVARPWRWIKDVAGRGHRSARLQQLPHHSAGAGDVLVSGPDFVRQFRNRSGL